MNASAIIGYQIQELERIKKLIEERIEQLMSEAEEIEQVRQSILLE